MSPVPPGGRCYADKHSPISTRPDLSVFTIRLRSAASLVQIVSQWNSPWLACRRLLLRRDATFQGGYLQVSVSVVKIRPRVWLTPILGKVRTIDRLNSDRRLRCRSCERRRPLEQRQTPSVPFV